MVGHNIIPVRLLQIAKMFGLTIVCMFFYRNFTSSVDVCDCAGIVDKVTTNYKQETKALLAAEPNSFNPKEEDEFSLRLMKLLKAENPNKNTEPKEYIGRAVVMKEIYLTNRFNWYDGKSKLDIEHDLEEVIENLLEYRSNAPKNKHCGENLKVKHRLIEIAKEIVLNYAELDEKLKSIKASTDPEQKRELESEKNKLEKENKALWEELRVCWFSYNPAIGIFENCDDLGSDKDKEIIQLAVKRMQKRKDADEKLLSIRRAKIDSKQTMTEKDIPPLPELCLLDIRIMLIYYNDGDKSKKNKLKTAVEELVPKLLYSIHN